MLPLSKNPPTRFPQQKLISETQTPWWVAKVKPRQEKALAEDLIERNIEYYLPMYTKAYRRKDTNKIRKSMLCLFPGYISFSPPVGGHSLLYSTGRIVNFVEVKNQKRFILQLQQIYNATELGVSIEPVADMTDLEPGELVEVLSGPLKGVKGEIIKLHSNNRLILSVDVLGKAMINIEKEIIRPINPSSENQ